jgi:hypothetical protein
VTTATSTGSGSYANQPAGATTITERRFDAVAEDGWPSPILANGGTAAITMDPAAPKSPDSVMQVTYPTGYPAGTTPFDQSVRTGGNYTQFYGSVWLKYSSGFAVDNAGILKILYIWGDDEMPSLCLCVNNYSGGNGNFTPQLGLQDATNVNLVPNVSGQVGYGFPTGQWVRLEFFLQMNTPGNSDGIAKVWANGVLVSNYTNVNYIAGSTQHYWWKYELAPYWGGAGGTVATPQYVWFDHLYGSGH